MRILHTSDWHLGKYLHEHPLLEDQRHALQQLLDVIERRPFDALVIAGDVYDRSIPPVEAVQLFSWFLTGLRKISGLPVLLIPGNHDSAARLSFCSDFMELSDVYFRTDPQAVDEPVIVAAGNERAAFYLVPFLEPAVYESFSEDEEPRRPTHETALQEAVRRMTAKMNDRCFNIMVGHLYTQGGIAADSERKFVGTAGEVDPGLFIPFDYTALGHLHRLQQPSERVRYSGSLLPYSFSECGDVKGVLEVEIGKGILSVTPVPIEPRRRLVSLSGNIHELLNDDSFLQYTDCYVEARLRDHDVVVNPLSVLRDRFPHILTVRQQPRAGEEGGACEEVTERTVKTIDEDFVLFHEWIHGDKPDEGKMRIFLDLTAAGVTE